MKIETSRNCGDLIFTFTGERVQALTVGEIRAKYTYSTGAGSGFMDRLGTVTTVDGNGFGNYSPQPENYQEEYMCVETGIGSGNVYRLNETCWLTEEEATVACAKRIQENKELKAREQKQRDDYLLSRETMLRSELESIERLKNKLEENNV